MISINTKFDDDYKKARHKYLEQKNIIAFPESYSIVDIETSNDKIIEIGAIRVRKNVIVDRYSSLVNIYEPISKITIDKTGITDSMLINAPDILPVMTEFWNFVGDDIMVAHNALVFDIRIIYDTTLQLFDRKLSNNFVDTLQIGRILFPNFPSHTQDYYKDFFEINNLTSHRSIADCEALYTIYNHMWDINDEFSIIDIGKPIKPETPPYYFPDDYCVLALNTSAWDCTESEIIEIAAVKVRDRQVVDSFDMLVHTSECISKDTQRITNITPDMLVSAESLNTVLDGFYKFIGNDILVKHNIDHDLDFINYHCGKHGISLTLNHKIDLSPIAHELIPDMLCYGVQDIANYYGIDFFTPKKLLNYCRTEYNCFECLRNDNEKYIATSSKHPPLAQQFNSDIKHFINKCRAIVKTPDKNSISPNDSDIPIATTDYKVFPHPDHPFNGKKIVITGEMEAIQRQEAKALIEQVGGKVTEAVSMKTDYFVIGADNGKMKDGKSTKMREAEKCIANGSQLQLLTPDTFLELLLWSEDKCSEI